jgi:hypothetical protein
VYRRLPPYVSGAEDYSRERGKSLFLNCKEQVPFILIFLMNWFQRKNIFL